jgi:hypothetical protein
MWVNRATRPLWARALLLSLPAPGNFVVYGHYGIAAELFGVADRIQAAVPSCDRFGNALYVSVASLEQGVCVIALPRLERYHMPWFPRFQRAHL